MNELLSQILQWMKINGYRRASFDRLCGIIPAASTYEQLDQLIADNPHILRSSRIKGGMDGLSLQDGLEIDAAIAMANPPPVEEEVVFTIPTLEGAPKVSTNDVESEIVDEYYRNAGSAVKAPVGSSLYNVTLCFLQLRNGFVIVGKSACVDSANFNEAIGRQLAREDAIKQVWPYLGFRLADKRLAA